MVRCSALPLCSVTLALLVLGASSAQAQRSQNQVRAPKPEPRSQRTVSASPAWQIAGRSRGQRDIQALHTGDGPFRVVLLSSLAGNDPLSTTAVDRLAAHITRNAGIVGGFRAVLVRSPNPDASALKRFTNAAHVRIETAFPRPGANTANPEPEVQFVTRLIHEFQPHRIIHLTPAEVEKPVVLHNRAATDLAKDLSGWLRAARKPNTRFAPHGSLEHHVGESAEVITLLIPRTSQPANVWDEFGDSLLACFVPPLGAPQDEWPPPTAENPRRPRVLPSRELKVEELPRPGRR